MKTKHIFVNFFLLSVVCIVAFALGETVMRSLGYYGVAKGSIAPAQMLVADEILDYRVPPNLKQTTQYGLPYKTNRMGWRDYEYTYEKPDDTFRIVMIGDSVLNGHGVHTEEIYAKHLERELNDTAGSTKYEVIMLSIGALNTIQEAHLLRQEGIKYDPDLVVVGYVLNDPSPGTSLRKSIEREKNLSYYQKVRRSLKQSAFLLHTYLTLERVAWDLGVQLGGTGLGTRLIKQNYFVGLHEDEKSWQRVVEGFTQISETARSKGIPVIVAIFPILYHLDSYPWTEVHTKVTDEAKSHGMFVLDLLPVYQTHAESTVRKGGGDYIHPNATGHEVAGEAILSFLLENNLLQIHRTE